jgi:hypothetical protein
MHKERGFGAYDYCFRITHSHGAWKVLPFNMDTITEPTTFATCLIVLQKNGHYWLESNSRTVNGGTHFRDDAMALLGDLFQQWVSGTLGDKVLVEQFNDIRDFSKQAILESEGKTGGLTIREFEEIARDWHRVLDHEIRFWDKVLPPNEPMGKYGLGGCHT